MMEGHYAGYRNQDWKKILSIKSINSSFFLIIVVLFFFFLPSRSFAQNHHDLFTELLSKYVTDGKIDFTDLCRDDGLHQYTDQLKNTDLASMTDRKERFAFWLNAYNAYSLEAICNRYPIRTINDLNFGGLIISVLLKKSVWDKPFVMVDHKPYTLRQVDHEILRPTFKDPRIQFAIACGAIGCAPSRSEAYEGGRLDAQLDDQARKFINDPRINTFNKDTKTAAISILFNWSRQDFGKTEADVLLFLAKYLPTDVAQSIRQDPAAWKIAYNPYDLDLNDAKNQG